MPDYSKDIFALLSTQFFQNMCSCEKVELSQLYSMMNFLIKANIPFTLLFSEGTHKEAKRATLTIDINPSTSISKLFQLEPGTTKLF